MVAALVVVVATVLEDVSGGVSLSWSAGGDEPGVT